MAKAPACPGDLAEPGFESGAAGLEARMLPLCYEALLSHKNLNFSMTYAMYI